MNPAARLTEADLDAATRRAEEAITAARPANPPQPTEPLAEYDVERSLPWFPLACVLLVLAGAFLPPMLQALGVLR